MMKPVFTLVAFMFFASMLFAQSARKVYAAPAAHSRVLNGLLQRQGSNNNEAMRTTTGVPMERVIAQSTHDSTGIQDDSVYIGYRLSRTSTYDYNTMVYPYNYPYNTSPMFNYAGIFTKPQVQFDTFIHWTIDPNTYIYGYYETAYATYDTATYEMKGYLDIFADSTINPNMRYVNKFNAARNIDSSYWFTWQLGISDSVFKQFFTYNSSGKLVKDSTYEMHLGAWRIASRSLYTYNTAGNLTQIDNYANTTDTSFTLPLPEQLQYVNTYDASNRLATVYSRFYDGDSLLPYIQDTFAYSGANTYHNSWREYQYDPINRYWAPIFNMTKTANSLGLPDTVNIQGFDSLMNAWIPQTMDIISYNTFHDPDTLQEYDYNFTNFPARPSFTTVYYYRSFINTEGVLPVAAAKDNAIIYPNPATNTVTISQLDVPQNSLVSISIMDVNGQMVSRENMHWQNQAQITVSGLVPGIYWLVIQDAAGNMVHRQAVVKQ